MTQPEQCGHEPKVARGMCRRCYGRQYYRTKPDYAANLREQRRARYAANREAENAAARSAYAKNSARHNERRRQWREANPERAREAARAWRLQNLDRAAAAAHRRRARLAGAGGTFTPQDWADLLVEFDACCAYCQARPERLVVEHMKPLVRGGSNDKSNIVPACAACNARKGTRTIFEFLTK